jgi:benzoylformate decarboxylase
MYNALVGKMPLVVTAGQQDSRMLVREPILSHDLVAMARPVSKWAVQLQHAEEIPVIFPRAFKVAQDAPRGPVFIALPSNVIDQQADLQLPGASALHRRTRPDPAGIAAAADLLARAQHPVIVCGDGVAASQAQAELVQVAEQLGAQVWSTVITGALGFPNMHAHYRGDLPPEYPLIRRALGDADVVLGVGADLFDEVWYNEGATPLPEGCALIQIDTAAWTIGKNLSPTIGLLADPKLALQELSEMVVPAMTGTRRQQAEQRRLAMAAQKQHEQARQEQRAREKWQQSPVAPARLMAALRDGLPPDVVVYNEAITATADMNRTLPLEQGRLFGNHGGGIGQGLPGALGVQLANPGRPVVALVGDGSAMYTVQSFWTAARHQIPVLYVILSNRSYRILKLNMNRYRRTVQVPPGRPYPFMDLTNPTLDFVEIAHGMGVAGLRVDHPDAIQPAIMQALASRAPYVLEVITEGNVPAQ